MLTTPTLVLVLAGFESGFLAAVSVRVSPEAFRVRQGCFHARWHWSPSFTLDSGEFRTLHSPPRFSSILLTLLLSPTDGVLPRCRICPHMMFGSWLGTAAIFLLHGICALLFAIGTRCRVDSLWMGRKKPLFIILSDCWHLCRVPNKDDECCRLGSAQQFAGTPVADRSRRRYLPRSRCGFPRKKKKRTKLCCRHRIAFNDFDDVRSGRYVFSMFALLGNVSAAGRLLLARLVLWPSSSSSSSSSSSASHLASSSSSTYSSVDPYSMSSLPGSTMPTISSARRRISPPLRRSPLVFSIGSICCTLILPLFVAVSCCAASHC